MRRCLNGCPLLRVCVHGMCVHLDGLNAEHEFWVWVTILSWISRHFHFQIQLHRKSMHKKLPMKGKLIKSCSENSFWRNMSAVVSSRRMLHTGGGWGVSPFLLKRFEWPEKSYINIRNYCYYVTSSEILLHFIHKLLFCHPFFFCFFYHY